MDRHPNLTNEQLKNYEKWWGQVSKKIEISDVAGPVKLGPPRMEDTPRFPPTTWPVPKEALQKNLEKYVKLALSLGAIEAKAIRTTEIPQDLRTLYVGCLNPSCRWLNSNMNCPMLITFPFDHMKKFVTEYEYAIVYKVVPPAMAVVPDVGKIDLDMYYTMGDGDAPDKAMLARNIIRLRILSEMTRRIRQAAYYNGYILAAPIGNGPCLVSKCADIRRCPALEKGSYCRFVDVSPVGCVVYIDYFTLGRKLGWGELQVGGNCAFPEDVPSPDGYYNIGLVLIE